jgi:hypothetical protein
MSIESTRREMRAAIGLPPDVDPAAGAAAIEAQILAAAHQKNLTVATRLATIGKLLGKLDSEKSDAAKRAGTTPQELPHGPVAPGISGMAPTVAAAFGSVVLRLATSPGVAVGPARTAPDGQPVRRFKKELIRVGEFFKASENLSFTVTPERIDHWAATFSRMAANGVKVPVPASHTSDPTLNKGWVASMSRQGNSLMADIDLVGDGITLAGTTDVSIYAVPEFIDGTGNEYTWPILHVALCTDPVVPGLAAFVPVAASHAGGLRPWEQAVLDSCEHIRRSEAAREKRERELAWCATVAESMRRDIGLPAR